MSGNNVDNFFAQTGGTDNALNIGGTMTAGSGSSVTLAGTNVLSGSNSITGALTTTGGANIKSRFATIAIGDVSASGTLWLVPGVAGTIVKITSVIDAAITSVDAGITFKIATVLITNSAITIANSGSAAGTVDSSAPTAANTVTAVQAIEIIKDGLSSTASLATLTFEILPT